MVWNTRVVVGGQGGERGGSQGVVGRMAGELEQNRDAARPAHLAKDLEELELFGAIGPVVGQFVQRFRDGFGLALTQAERHRLAAISGQGIGQLRRESRDRPARHGRFEPRHQSLDVIGPRRHRQQPRAVGQVAPGSRRGEPPHQPFLDRCPHDRQVPGRTVLEQSQHGLRVAANLCFERPPEQERQVDVACILTPRQQCRDDR